MLVIGSRLEALLLRPPIPSVHALKPLRSVNSRQSLDSGLTPLRTRGSGKSKRRGSAPPPSGSRESEETSSKEDEASPLKAVKRKQSKNTLFDRNAKGASRLDYGMIILRSASERTELIRPKTAAEVLKNPQEGYEEKEDDSHRHDGRGPGARREWNVPNAQHLVLLARDQVLVVPHTLSAKERASVLTSALSELGRWAKLQILPTSAWRGLLCLNPSIARAFAPMSELASSASKRQTLPPTPTGKLQLDPQYGARMAEMERLVTGFIQGHPVVNWTSPSLSALLGSDVEEDESKPKASGSGSEDEDAKMQMLTPEKIIDSTPSSPASEDGKMVERVDVTTEGLMSEMKNQSSLDEKDTSSPITPEKEPKTLRPVVVSDGNDVNENGPPSPAPVQEGKAAETGGGLPSFASLSRPGKDDAPLLRRGGVDHDQLEHERKLEAEKNSNPLNMSFRRPVLVKISLPLIESIKAAVSAGGTVPNTATEKDFTDLGVYDDDDLLPSGIISRRSCVLWLSSPFVSSPCLQMY